MFFPGQKVRVVNVSDRYSLLQFKGQIMTVERIYNEEVIVAKGRYNRTFTWYNWRFAPVDDAAHWFRGDDHV